MAWTFPLAVSDFFATLKLSSFVLRASFGQETSGQGSGRTIVKDLRPPLWTANAQTVDMIEPEFTALETWIEVLGEGRGSFLAYDTRRQWPRLDPRGVILGDAAPTIGDIDGRLQLAVDGLPEGYGLSFGDLIGFNDGVSTQLHRIVEASVAGEDGLTPLFSIEPELSLATSTGIPVTLVRPPVEMRIVPGSYDPEKGQSSATRTATFQCEQAFGD